MFVGEYFLRSNSPSPHEHVDDEEENGKAPTARGICFMCEHMIFTIRLFRRFTNDFFSSILKKCTLPYYQPGDQWKS